MKKALTGILLGLMVLCHSINVQAEDQPTTIEFTYDEAQLLLKVAEAEAGTEGVDGMWMVLSVIVNRVESEDFPDTVSEVIYQKNQFATVTNGMIDKIEPSDDAHLALARIEGGEVADKIVAFENKKSSSLERYFWRAFAYKRHVFYTAKQ